MTDTSEVSPSQELSRIDEPLQRKRLGDMSVSKWAGLTFSEYREAIEFAKLMAQARNSVPAYLKGNPGDCLAIITQSLRWRLEPYWVSQHSYVAKAESLIAYDAAVHAAIVLSSGLLSGRPQYAWNGDGDERTCTVTVTLKENGQVLSYTTPPLKQIRPPKSDKSTATETIYKGSPLWVKDPDQQQAYYAVRNLGRRHFPEILGGVYDREEFDDTTQEPTELAMPPSPNLLNRLPGKMEGAGFAENVVDEGLREEADKQEADQKAEKKAKAAKAKEPEPEPEPTPAPAPPKQPQTAGEYQVYALAWIGKEEDPDNLEARWDGEKEMRAALKVQVSTRKMIEGALKEKVAELRAKKKKR